MTSSVVRIGTRRSPLALAQSEWVASRLADQGHAVELVPVVTEGDTSSAPLRQIGGSGVFVSALRDALVRGQVDVAVHSLKDLPTAPEPGLSLAAVPPREDPRDALVARDGLTVAALPAGARVGTGSPRRAAQLRAHRPDLEVVDIRGNVDTRLGLVADATVDAVLLARAGLVRLGRLDRITEVIDPSVMLPAPGQGALAVEVRALDGPERPFVSSLRTLDDPASRAAVTAERAVLAGLEAGCSAPVGALAVADEPGFAEPVLSLHAVVASVDGTTIRRMSITAPVAEAAEVGHELARRLLSSADAVITGDVAR
jgi:hydroxymethylbilane synthase